MKKVYWYSNVLTHQAFEATSSVNGLRNCSNHATKAKVTAWVSKDFLHGSRDNKGKGTQTL